MREVPSGPIDGVNRQYTLSTEPAPYTLYLYMNGLLLEEGPQADYTVPAPTTILMAVAPLSGDKLDATYTPLLTYVPPEPHAGLGLNLADDYLVFDDPVTVLFKAKVSPTELAPPVEVHWVYREAEVKGAVDDNTDLAKKAIGYTLWRKPLLDAGVTAPPKRHDVLEYDDHEYVIQVVDEQDRDRSGLVQRYRCACVQVP